MKGDFRMYNFDSYFDAHSASSNHMSDLLRSQVCGCFYCLRTFEPDDIEEWIIDDNPIDRKGTAICPYCGVDAVIGDKSGYPITERFLRGMKKVWFDE